MRNIKQKKFMKNKFFGLEKNKMGLSLQQKEFYSMKMEYIARNGARDPRIGSGK